MHLVTMDWSNDNVISFIVMDIIIKGTVFLQLIMYNLQKEYEQSNEG